MSSVMLEQIEKWARLKPNAPALLDMQSDNRWAVQDWKTFWTRTQAVGRGLVSLGIKPGDKVALISKNRSEWLICQHGIAAAGAILCPIYPTVLAKQVAYILESTAAKIVIIDGKAQLEKIRAVQAEAHGKPLPIIMFENAKAADDVMSLSALETLGHPKYQKELDRRAKLGNANSVAMLIFTSGTTGLPKGAEITNRGIDMLMANVISVGGEALNPGDHSTLSYLPLCHAAEQVFTNFVGLNLGSKIHFCREMIDVKDHILAARPTYILGIPRVWEKFEMAMRASFTNTNGLKGKMLSWARRTEVNCVKRELKTAKPYWPLKRKVARKLVISKILERLGLQDLRLACSGAAPISEDTLWFFMSIGLPIHEGYGMTETTGLAITQPVKGMRLGSVGKPIPGVSAKVSENGELLLQGDNMVKGYDNLPEKSDELWSDGWMHTGDLASIDNDGFVTIKGRIKEIIITSGGKNIAPVEIEEHLLHITGIGQAIAVGDRRPFLVALLVLDEDSLPELIKMSGAQTNLSLAQAKTDDKINACIRQQLEKKCNSKLARFQQIKYYALLDEAFSEENGELTPTQKLKRPIVHENRAAVIEDIYVNAAIPKNNIKRQRT